MITTKLQQYFWFIFSTLGVLFFWIGLWDGIGGLPYINIWWVSILVGLSLYFLSSLVLKERNILMEVANPAVKIIRTICQHPEKHFFGVKYTDKLKGKEKLVSGSQLKHVEKEFIVFLEEGQERFIPLSRVNEILYKGKRHWKP